VTLYQLMIWLLFVPHNNPLPVTEWPVFNSAGRSRIEIVSGILPRNSSLALLRA